MTAVTKTSLNDTTDTAIEIGEKDSTSRKASRRSMGFEFDDYELPQLSAISKTLKLRNLEGRKSMETPKRKGSNMLSRSATFYKTKTLGADDAIRIGEEEIKILDMTQKAIWRRHFWFPHCCAYFTWMVIILIICGFGFVVLAFGIQFD